MKLYHDLSLWADEAKHLVHSIIEVPMGSMVKYEFNKDLNAVEVDRFFSAPMGMPHNYGFLPQSHNAEDGDPLDIVVVSQYSIAPGTIAKARVIGLLNMIDGGELDYKIIGVGHKDMHYDHIHDVMDLNIHQRKQIEYFFLYYKKLEGKHVEINGFEGKDRALEIIKASAKTYQQKYH